jgi:hypothetical protein
MQLGRKLQREMEKDIEDKAMQVIASVDLGQVFEVPKVGGGKSSGAGGAKRQKKASGAKKVPR